ncbi:MAG: glycosyltransferase family 4 protein [Chloroflexi bacterium]|nr:glycosyltransferase family 4 protein [Chloroflexota bacterium]
MKLVIISHTEHHLRDGVPVGWGPTVREISQLAGMFSSIRHVAMLYDGGAPQGEVAYDADNVTLVGLRPSGGSGLRAKLGILAAYPRYAAVLLREIAAADVVHVRAPANISLLAILLLPFLWRPARRWIKYAGNWKPDAPDALTYRLQRWLLQRGWHRAQVTVNGHWPGDPPFIHNFINPCLTDEEFAGGQVVGSGKTMSTPLRLLFVGRLERAKGVERGLRVAAALRASGVALTYDLIGDGPERADLEALAGSLGLSDSVTFHGWVARAEIAPFYSQAHLLLFPTSSSEGWPKVISEAMAYGVVPLAGAVSAIPQVLEQFKVGMAIPPGDLDAYTAAARAYLDDPARWTSESRRAMDAAARFTYSRFMQDVRCVLDLPAT